MPLDFHHGVTLVAHGALVRLDAVPGLRIGCVRGGLWVTLPGEARDHVLRAGMTLAFERPGVALVNALGGDAALGLEPGIRLHYARRGHGCRSRRRATLGASIERIRPRYDTSTPAGAAVARQRSLIEAEARRMRAQVLELLLIHAGAAIGRGYARWVRRPLSTLADWLRGVRAARRSADSS